MKPDVSSFGVDNVKFADGTTEEIDAVIYVVGFKSLHSCLDDFDAGIFTGRKLSIKFSTICIDKNNIRKWLSKICSSKTNGS